MKGFETNKVVVVRPTAKDSKKKCPAMKGFETTTVSMDFSFF